MGKVANKIWLFIYSFSLELAEETRMKRFRNVHVPNPPYYLNNFIQTFI